MSLDHRPLLFLRLICFSSLIFPFQVYAVKPIPPAVVAVEPSRILKDSIVEEVNSNPHAGWKAAPHPRFANYTIGQFRRLLGVKQSQPNSLGDVPVVTHSRYVNLPKQFDARSAWPQCPAISDILDQGHCGACWAFAAVEALQDRFCIHFNLSITLSVNDLLACCSFFCGDGCDGGYPIQAWKYFVRSGVVTGECDPYFDTEGCAHPGCSPVYSTPRCERKCTAGNQLWGESKHYAVDAYRVKPHVSDIMAEIHLRGPVEVDFTVYEDFAYYKSGIYRHITGDVIGGHAVKLIGWGTSEDGEDYWLLANQWNRGWGDDGYFKIIKGRNECGIESNPVAGMPSTKNIIKNLVSMDVGDDVAV